MELKVWRDAEPDPKGEEQRQQPDAQEKKRLLVAQVREDEQNRRQEDPHARLQEATKERLLDDARRQTES